MEVEAPDGWKRKSLGDLVEIKRGISWSNDQEVSEGTVGAYPVLGIPNVQDKLELSDIRFISGIDSKKAQSVLAKKGWALMVGSNGNPKRVGNCVYINETGAYLFASFLLGLHPIDDKVIQSEFMFRILCSDPIQKSISDSVQGSTGLKNISVKMLRDEQVLLPPLSEQKKIAEILESVDDAIAKTESVIAQTQRVKQGLLQQLLTRGIGHTKFKQIELGEIPESWDILPIGDIVTFYNGKAHEQDISEEGSHVVVNSKFISTEGEVRKFTNSPSLIAHSHDVLIVMSDIPNGKAIAKCFYVDQDNLYTVNQRIGLLRSKKDDPKFLFYALNRNPYFLSFDDGAKQTNLRKDEVLACPVALPKDVTEQQKISGCLTEVDNLIISANRDLIELRLLKSGLMSDLLTGRVRVNINTTPSNKIEEAA